MVIDNNFQEFKLDMSSLTDYDEDRIKVKLELNTDRHKNDSTCCNQACLWVQPISFQKPFWPHRVAKYLPIHCLLFDCDIPCNVISSATDRDEFSGVPE